MPQNMGILESLGNVKSLASPKGEGLYKLQFIFR